MGVRRARGRYGRVRGLELLLGSNADPRELLAKEMNRLFDDRVAEKQKVLSWVRAGTELDMPLPSTEVDESVVVPQASSSLTAASLSLPFGCSLSTSVNWPGITSDFAPLMVARGEPGGRSPISVILPSRPEVGVSRSESIWSRTISATNGCGTFASSTFAFVMMQSLIRAEFDSGSAS